MSAAPTAPSTRTWVACAFGMAVVASASSARAQAARPSGHSEEAFDIMNVLSDEGLHDLKNERWNVYGQFTYISSWKLPFSAKYTNLNGSNHSLSTSAERSFTGSFTLFFGARLWKGGEVYLAPEIISLRPFSNLTGLGGAVQNFELQKTGAETPELYRARAYVQQRINLGGRRVQKTSDPLQLGAEVDSRRIVLRLGSFTILDFFDRNAFSSDPRQQFFNLAFMTYSAYDFASDARGYSWGAVAELFWDDWAIRYGRITPPKQPNVLPNEMRFWKYYGDQVELEHKHEIKGLQGTVRLLGYLNRGWIGSFDDAISAYQADPGKNAANCGERYHYNSTNPNAPDLCWVRKTNWKGGVGLSVDQYLTRDIGLFLRGMISDGRMEVYAYMPPDRSAAFGFLGKGAAWKRPFDLAGVALGLAWISHSHAEYLRMGGVDGFIGDGSLRQGMESVAEVFYSFNVLRAVWLSADYQHITNPAFNKDRGPVEVLSGRVHAEF